MSPQRTVAQAQRLWANTAATRVRITTWGTTKALSRAQNTEAAEAFGADPGLLRATKRLIPRRSPWLRSIHSIISSTRTYWTSISLPFPEPGVRLIRRDHLIDFNNRMITFRADFDQTVDALTHQIAAMRAEAREHLGSLYDAEDYPSTLTSSFAMSWSVLNVDPPPYLQNLCPDLYRQELRRARARFSEAMTLIEEGFIMQLAVSACA